MGHDFLLIQGGSPLAQRVADHLDDPEVQEQLREGFIELGRIVNAWAESLQPALVRLGEAATAAAKAMREAGLIEEQPPIDSRARALWLRQHRNTGPDRQIQHQRRTKETA